MMMRFVRWIGLSSAVVMLTGVSACSDGGRSDTPLTPQSSAVEVHVPGSVTIPVGGSVRLPGDGATITFRVAGEGRCPEGAQCIRADYVTVDLTVRSGGASHDVQLGSGWSLEGHAVPEDTTIDGLKIHYVDLTPRPQVDGGFPNPVSYKVELALSR